MAELSDTPGPGELDDRILPWSQVKVISGLSRTTVWRLQKSGDFPACVQVSRNRVGWWQSELLAWKRSRTPRRLPAARPAASPDPTPPSPKLPEHVQRPPGEGLLRHAGPKRRSRRPKAAGSPHQGSFDF